MYWITHSNLVLPRLLPISTHSSAVTLAGSQHAPTALARSSLSAADHGIACGSD